MTLLNDDDDFSICRFNLELEAERNSSLMRKYGKKLTIVSGQVKDAKRKLDFIETEQAENIRNNPKNYGLKDKVTDKVAYGLAKNEPEYVEHFNKFIRLSRLEEDYKNAVKTCEQRGMMIGILAKLWLNNYYSKPVVHKEKKKKLRSKDDFNEMNEFDEKLDNNDF